jgi:hypothetical protein
VRVDQRRAREEVKDDRGASRGNPEASEEVERRDCKKVNNVYIRALCEYWTLKLESESIRAAIGPVDKSQRRRPRR